MLTRNWHRQAVLASAALAGLGLAARASTAHAAAAPVNATWTSGVGGSWNDPANWSSNPDYPSGVGAGATFNGATDANRTISAIEVITLGTLTHNSDSAFNTTVAGGGGSLVFDHTDAGPAVITAAGTGGGNLTISSSSAFTDSVLAVVNQTSATSAAGSLNWTGGVTTSAAGFTKQGGGMLTLGTALKRWTGPTLFDTNSGRTRISVAGRPADTSSVTVMPGAQLEFITASANYTFGTGPLNLNGTGLGPGSHPGNFPGVIRPSTNLAITVNNPIVLQSDSLIHVQGSAGGVLTFSNTVSGPGALIFTAPGQDSDGNIGKLVLGSATANTYAGGTVVHGGTIDVVSGGGLGTGPLTVNANVQSGFVMNTVVNLSTTEPTTVGSLSGAITTAAGSTVTINNGGQNFTVNQTADGTYVGAIAGTGGFGLGATSTHTLTLTSPQTYTGGTTVAGGTLALATDLTNSSSVSVTGGTLRLTPLQTRVIRTPGVSTSGTGKIDLTDNKLITASAAGTFVGAAYDGVAGLVDSARGSAGNALWDGPTGITTSDTRAINNGDLVSIGVAKVSEVRTVADTETTTFAGQTVLGSDTLAMVTWGGDANLDGKINIDDYGRIDGNVGQSGSVFGWSKGDFNYDGKINIDDYGIIDGNINRQGVPFSTGGSATSAALEGASAVPEPASLSFLALAGLGLMRRRRGT